MRFTVSNFIPVHIYETIRNLCFSQQAGFILLASHHVPYLFQAAPATVACHSRHVHNRRWVLASGQSDGVCGARSTARLESQWISGVGGGGVGGLECPTVQSLRLTTHGNPSNSTVDRTIPTNRQTCWLLGQCSHPTANFHCPCPGPWRTESRLIVIVLVIIVIGTL